MPGTPVCSIHHCFYVIDHSMGNMLVCPRCKDDLERITTRAVNGERQSAEDLIKMALWKAGIH